MSALKEQIGGSHYKDMPIQPMEYSMANNLDACQHTAIKYVTRFRQKGGIQDLHKAIHVIQMLIEFEEQAAAEQTVTAETVHDEPECNHPSLKYVRPDVFECTSCMARIV